MLTLFEEVVLLTIDPATGALRGGSEWSVRYALAGALLFDLALAKRIDTDLETITVTNPAPTGQPLQDALLADLASGAVPLRVRDCVEEVFRRHPDVEDDALEALTASGVISHQVEKRLWVIEIHRFPLVDGAPYRLVTDRLAQAILGDDIPDTRDIMLVSLANACGLLGRVVTPAQIAARADWIHTLSSIETISRTIGSAIAGLMKDLASGAPGMA